MKEILIINGSGGVGKDTFVTRLSKFTTVCHTSIINPIKRVAAELGWTGKKTEKDRRFLSDLKVLVDEYNDWNYGEMEKVMQNFLDEPIDGILCIDMREKRQIDKARRDFGAKAILVKRDTVKQITSNIADAGVYDAEYDYTVYNNGTIEDLDEEARKLFAWLKQNRK